MQALIGAALLFQETCFQSVWTRCWTRMHTWTGVCALALVISLFAIALPAFPASAGILSKLLREAGEAGGKAGKHGIGSLDNAAGALRKLPDGDAATALAVHATPEGHWVFVNKKGDQFTAGTPDELTRAPGALLGASHEGEPLSLYLTEDTVFKRADRLKDLPENANLSIVAGKKAYRLVPRPEHAIGFVAQVRSNLSVQLSKKVLLHEALYRLQRPLNSANIRVLALEPGGPKRLSSVPGYDPKSKRRLSETVEPAALKSALARLKGQTVVVTGEVKGSQLHFKPRSGPVGQIELNALAEAARAADVNLVVLKSSSPTQPGARTWLWQTVEVQGLETALKRPTFADFLQSLTANSGDLVIDTSHGGKGRLRITAKPLGTTTSEGGSQFGTWIDAVSEQVTGTIATNGITAFTRDRETEREHALRLVPGIPSTAQSMYAIGLFAGLMGLGLAREWWRKIWPQEKPQEYRGNIGYQAARIVRGLVFVVLFLPFIGLPAMVWTYLGPVVRFVLAPFRFFIKLFRSSRAS